jgi:hypothetical protein
VGRPRSSAIALFYYDVRRTRHEAPEPIGPEAEPAAIGRSRETAEAVTATDNHKPAGLRRRVFLGAEYLIVRFAIRGIDGPVPEWCTAIAQCTGFGVRHE